MVSQEFANRSASSVLRRCITSDMDDHHRIHCGDLGSALYCDGKDQNDLIQLSMPSDFQSPGEQFFGLTDMLHNQRSEDSELGRRHLVNCQAEKRNNFHGFMYGCQNRLSLTLGSHPFSDVLSPNQYKQTQLNSMSSNYTLAREDSAEFHPQSAKHARDDYMFCECEKTSSGDNTSNPADCMSCLTTAFQNSPYLKPAQELLDEVVCVSNAVEQSSNKQSRKHMAAGMTDRISGRSFQARERMNNHEVNTRWTNHYSSEKENDAQVRITKLVALLDELESRYEQYFSRMDQVVSSFEVVAGSGAAASYTALTIQAMSRHFSHLRDSIVAQIHASRESQFEDIPISRHKFSEESTGQKGETLRHLGMIQIRQVWRPLRGLPENSVAVLRAWLFEHFLHPYPDDSEKLMLASKTGLTRNQISNWFINARVRLWKPMIEEMYREEFAEESGSSNPSS
ncbi:BEL1-like homeodomain protein 11 [Phoenix dactylifera]|uniref:BEL1-like homeodomain protein 11 n=1 Tax=Phoenix dactylifera TaxID=42345 RepID=A0A8B7C8K2_PHODC|nr:BEL1-like homeodomain protein 11 [Phoenix dactylifera]XP_017699040.1 BEL1-like homeodomain protein 11 [Phoenix dactylifera]XP_017699042.1 BEL1-like homeodomain protein 11 [Phoenix dactylifera]XP_038990492.1 BEL1-like homeodomain protein 11 [Phoenix dactylifera]XP_038990493.1 BEL1-like homeodomain protein 11 [Phoenix dactylifera]